jgi:hypothetical protein
MEKFLPLLLSKDICWKREYKKKVKRIKTEFKNKPTFKEFTKTLNYQNYETYSEIVIFHI